MKFKARIFAELARLRDAQPTRLDVNRLRHVALERAKDLRSVLYTEVPKGRQALQQLLVAPITFKPDGPEYRREGATRFAALFAPEPSATRIRLASPRGFPRYITRLALPYEGWLQAA